MRDFAGTERFAIERQLGAGSMGTVYLAFDRELESRVALKTLRSVDASGIYRFKKEFRALADVSHRNLVCLHELFCEQRQWFFTMEYVEGQDLLSYLHGSRGRSLSPPPRGLSEPPADPGSVMAGAGTGLEMLFPSPFVDGPDARSALRQVVQGLQAVHAAGKLHRDLKPENVLVTKDGRAVLLDFGIAIDQRKEIHETLATVIGTPAYMSPEQCTGVGVTEATDWYALGVLLYEALTGDVPFDGSPMDVIRRKQEADPTPPNQMVADVPEDLNELCCRLLRRESAERPTAEEILSLLRHDSPADGAQGFKAADTGVADSPFVGRAAQLRDLGNALEGTDADAPVLALIHGPAGIGKTTLVDRFVQDVAVAQRAIVLKGRCYERESVPFKAFDSVVDSLSRFLRRVPAVEVASMLPRDVDALAELFPVLKRVDVLRKSRRRKTLPNAPQELRQRAFRALKEMLGRIADLEPLIIFIDDLQWSDTDSARLLAELLRGTDRPACLLICVYRSEEQSRGRGLRWLLSELRSASDLDIRELSLGALSTEESMELAQQLLGPDTQEGASRISFESKGNPHLLAQLARHIQERRASGLASPQTAQGLVSFERVLEQRLSQLSSDAKTLLDVLSVAGRPVPEPMLTLVSTFNDELSSALAELRGAKLVRGVSAQNTRAVEVYHDTIREALVRAMDEDQLADWHRRLAAALEVSGSPELEALTTHLLGAGEHDRAAHYAERAAAQAAKSLAFDKAARLYALAAEHTPNDAHRRRLLRARGDSLVAAGRGARAAESYERAAREASDPREADELWARAGVQALLSGRLESGLEKLREPMSRLGFSIPRSRDEALGHTETLWKDLRRRGFSVGDDTQQTSDNAALTRYDILRDVTSGLLLHDIHRALPLVAQCLDLALALGEKARLVGALGLFHVHVDLPYSRAFKTHAGGALDVAEALARGLPDARVRAEAAFARGISVYYGGSTQSAMADLTRAEELLRNHCPSRTFEIRTSRTALAHLQVCVTREPDRTRIAQWRHEAEEHDDSITALRLCVLEGIAMLCAGDADGARAYVDEARIKFGEPTTRLTEFGLRLFGGALALHRGNFDDARTQLYRLDDFFDGGLATVPLVRAHILLLRARLSLLVRLSPDAPAGCMKRAEADIAEAQALALPCMEDDIRLARATLAAIAKERSTACAMLDALLADHESEATAPLLALFAERAKGWLIGGDEGRILVSRSTAMIKDRGIAHPGRMSRQLMPGLESAAQEAPRGSTGNG